MDDRSPPSQPRRGLLSGGYVDNDARRAESPRGKSNTRPRRGLLSGGYDDTPPRAQPDTQPRRGLLSGGYGAAVRSHSGGDAGGDGRKDAGEPEQRTAPASGGGRPGGLLRRFAPSPGERLSGWDQLTGVARRLGQTLFCRAV
ncbi:MAG TPA: hypothetical protein VF725_05580 [Ktedonobacterales bacterium]